MRASQHGEAAARRMPTCLFWPCLYRLQVRLTETEASCSRIALRSRCAGSPAIAAAKSAAQVARRQLKLSLQSSGYFTTTKLRCSCERRRQYSATSADRTAQAGPGWQMWFTLPFYAVCGKVRPPCTEKMATCKCNTRTFMHPAIKLRSRLVLIFASECTS